MKIQAKIWLPSWSLFLYILEASLVDFGRFWRPSLIYVETKWHQNVISKPNQKTIAFSKASGTNFNDFLVDFGWLLGGPGGSKKRVFGWLVGSWSQDAPKTPPRAPQDAPRAPKSPILEDFCWIWGGFLKDFGFIFGSFLVHLLIESGWNLPTICLIILEFFEWFLNVFWLLLGSFLVHLSVDFCCHAKWRGRLSPKAT